MSFSYYIFLVMCAIFCFGVIIGYFGKSSDIPATNDFQAEALMMKQLTEDQFANEKDLLKEAIENNSTDRLRSYLQKLTFKNQSAK